MRNITAEINAMRRVAAAHAVAGRLFLGRACGSAP
jgi:hypothetical protein